MSLVFLNTFQKFWKVSFRNNLLHLDPPCASPFDWTPEALKLDCWLVEKGVLLNSNNKSSSSRTYYYIMLMGFKKEETVNKKSSALDNSI